MGIFSGLFKKKDNANTELANNGVVTAQAEVIKEPVQGVTNAEGPAANIEAEPVTMNSQSSVLEQMQNRYVEETAQENEKIVNEQDAMSIFNQNIELDGNNPMAIFGVESEDNNQNFQDK